MAVYREIGSATAKNSHAGQPRAQLYDPAAGQEHKLREADREALRQEDWAEDQPWDPADIAQALRTARGLPRACEHNFMLVLRHDPRYCNNAFYNSFADKVIIPDPARAGLRDYNPDEGLQGRHLATFKSQISERYDLSGRSAFETAFQALLNDRSFHPIWQYLSSVRDAHAGYLHELESRPDLPLGSLGVDTMLCDYLGAEPSEFLYACSRLHMAAAAGRIISPGRKYDHMLVLWSRRGGTGKTSFLNILFSPDWTKYIVRFTGKDAYIALRGTWCANADELNISSQTEASDVKRFITSDFDKFRHLYEGRDSAHGRTCVFWATANHPVVLSESAGNRRFWNFECSGRYTKSFADLKEARSRLFAEALHVYRRCYAAPGRQLELEDRFVPEAEANAEAARPIPLWEELCRMYIQLAVPPDFERYDPLQRQCFFAEHLGFPPPDALTADKVQRPWRETYADRSGGELITGAWQIQTLISTRQLLQDLQHAPGMRRANAGTIGRFLRTSSDLEYRHTMHGWVFVNHSPLQE